MALNWTVDHARRLIVATAVGALTIADFERWTVEREREKATGYRIIFDGSQAELELHSAELVALSQLFGERKREDYDGALALIARSEAEQEMAAYFARRSNAGRPCRIFSNVDAAHAWFAELDAAARR